MKKLVSLIMFALLLSALFYPKASVKATTDVCSTCASSCQSDAQAIYDSCANQADWNYYYCVNGGPSPTDPTGSTAPQKPEVCEGYRITTLSGCSTKRTDAYNACVSTFCNYGLGCRVPKAPTSLPGSN